MFMLKRDKIGFFVRFKVVWRQFLGEMGNITIVWSQIPSEIWISKTMTNRSILAELLEK